MLRINRETIGCSMLGRDDLFDKGFRHNELAINGLVIEIAGVRIELPPDPRRG